MKSYLDFVEVPNPGKKMRQFRVYNLDREYLGYVEFKTGWRRYVYNPEDHTAYDAECLLEIAKFLEELTMLWKDKLDLEKQRRAMTNS